MDEQPSIVAMAEMIDMLGLTRKRVSVLSNGAEFPAPLATLGVGRIWYYKDIAAWARRTGRAIRPIPAR